jgi:hypothetical protein
MRPNPISAETAQLLARKLNVPVEHIMHMPRHILLQKIAELGKAESPQDGDRSDRSDRDR